MFWIHFWNIFTKITAWPVQFLCFRTKIHYENKAVQDRRISGPALIISNHTSIFDYAVYIFVFIFRTLRVQMAEVLFEKKILSLYLKMMGGIRVDRNTHDFGFVTKSLSILEKGGVVGIFPESRIPKPGEERPLEFKTSAAYIALLSGVPVIPVVTNGSYFCRKRAEVLIGKPMDVRELASDSRSEKENIQYVSEAMRARIKSLTEQLKALEKKA
ncbi:MAG: 1-acyl-sn-glycerol-3-phosphate acyltransferase [Lachnospiraceae bacterium]|nr:1-acyl-sn-glycerol-3-phosphate acyltransferase [Lachnospiraceae bacterium]